MWFKLKFYNDRGHEMSLLGTVSPTDAEIYFDAESVADACGLQRQDGSADRRFVLRRATNFENLTEGHPRLRGLLPERVSTKKMLSTEKTVLLLALFSEGGGALSEMARILAADDFGKAVTYSLADDWYDLWYDHFFDPDRAVEVIVHPRTGDDDDDESTTVQQVVREMKSLMLEIYDMIENDENNY